jgi:5-methylcytosine-specific restriction endonuclease McrA
MLKYEGAARGTPVATIAHNEWSNLRALCKPCHSRRTALSVYSAVVASRASPAAPQP